MKQPAHQIADELMAMIQTQDSVAAKSLKRKVAAIPRETDTVTLTLSRREAMVLWMMVSNIDLTA